MTFQGGLPIYCLTLEPPTVQAFYEVDVRINRTTSVPSLGSLGTHRVSEHSSPSSVWVHFLGPQSDLKTGPVVYTRPVLETTIPSVWAVGTTPPVLSFSSGPKTTTVTISKDTTGDRSVKVFVDHRGRGTKTYPSM